MEYLLVSLVLLTSYLWNIRLSYTHSKCLDLWEYSAGSLFCALRDILVPSYLVKETTEKELATYSYKFGQEDEEETYIIVASHVYFERLIFQDASL